MLLIIDEMGKLLEEAATGTGDAFFFQLLAEAASRSNGRLAVIGVLHQAFDDYAYRLARETRDDWLKIQGRFVDVPLNPAGEEQLGLLAAAIGAANAPEELPSASVVARAVHGDQPIASELERTLLGCWPLNPVVATLLGPLSRRRFGQNQRSLFGFLSSAEPNGFQDFLASTDAESGALYDTDWLWRYLRSNLEPSILASPDGHRWSLSLDAVERCEMKGSDDLQLRLARAVALIDMLRERSSLVASPDVLAAALGIDRHVVARELETLVHWSVIIHRRHLGGYSLYAGSDFDIEAALRDVQKETLSCDYARLRGTGVFSPVLAKRHYHETGAMRWFEVDISPLDLAEEKVERFQGDSGAVGLFLLLVNEAGESRDVVRRRMAALAERIGDQAIAVGVSSDSFMLRELSLELIALEKMLTGRPELRGDAVARREVASRAARTSAELEERLRSALASTIWQVPGLELHDQNVRVSGAAKLSILASALAARIFIDAPTLSNELVNRTRPSSNAAAAVRALMVSMVSSPSEPRLGFTAYPPERGLYESILARTGLHREDENGLHAFLRPNPEADRSRLLPTWLEADRVLEAGGTDGVTLDALYQAWARRPLGIKYGLLPLLALAYILSEQHRLSVYLDGTFCPLLGDLFVDRMLQDPDAVRIRRTRVTARHAAILTGIASVTSRLLGRAAVALPDPLTIGRELVAVVTDAPVWTRRTGTLSVAASRVRNVALAADDPNKFMLDDLPGLFDLEDGPEAPDRFVGLLSSGLEEIAAAYPQMLGTLIAGMLRSLEVQPDDPEDRLKVRAADVVGLTGNYRLDAFANRLRAYDGTLDAMEGLASLAANKPPRDWVDRDVDQARLELAALAEEFLRAEALAHVKNRQPRQIRMAIYVSDPDRPSVTTTEFAVDDLTRKRGRQLAAKLRAIIDDAGSGNIGLAAMAELASMLAPNSAATGPATKSAKVAS
ncbi:ATP-binding protein [Methylobacterium brachiatum]|uniref:ATP-binding protein n=1 Tax=Methylobacterium brachiatum TaxID=269660 RepID=UPI0011139009|nr:ATP-binding protein [Methylobacterium brachiatum]